MELKIQSYSVLVVSASEKFNRAVEKYFAESRYSPVKFVSNAASANRILVDLSYDIILINAPLPDEFGTHLAMDLCRRSSAGVVLFVREEHYSDISARFMPYGIITLSKPTPPRVVMETMLMLCGTRERLRRLEKKAVPFEEKMEEIRLINRAKALLISELKMSEADAHRYIEKQAMDRCQTKRVIAEVIIKEHG